MKRSVLKIVLGFSISRCSEGMFLTHDTLYAIAIFATQMEPVLIVKFVNGLLVLIPFLLGYLSSLGRHFVSLRSLDNRHSVGCDKERFMPNIFEKEDFANLRIFVFEMDISKHTTT